MTRRMRYSFNTMIAVFLAIAWVGAIWPSPTVFACGAGLAALAWLIKGGIEYGHAEAEFYRSERARKWARDYERDHPGLPYTMADVEEMRGGFSHQSRPANTITPWGSE